MKKITRKQILELANKYNVKHVMSALSIVEIINSVYEVKSNIDEFILSKGHGYLALISILKNLGFNPKISEHPDRDDKNKIYCTTGSLGHGLPIAVGGALVNPNKMFYVLISDAEVQAGTTWESLLIINKYNLNNIKIIIDYNKSQLMGWIKDILPIEDLKTKLESFGCYVTYVDGHNEHLIKKELSLKSSKVHVIVANTIKGKGIKEKENKPGYQIYIPKMDELYEK